MDKCAINTTILYTQCAIVMEVNVRLLFLKYVKVSLLFFSILIFFAVKAQANEQLSITWLENDNKPFYLRKSNIAPYGGLCNHITDLLIDALPNIQHSKLTVPQKRAGKYIKDGHMACYTCLIHREDTNFVSYSIPTTVYPPFMVLTRPEKADLISSKHGSPLSLISLLTDPKLIFGQYSGRKFDPQIQQIATNTKLYEKAALNSTGSNTNYAILTQIANGYTDYTIDYPFIADFYNNHNDKKIIKLSIGEPKQDYILGAIGCSAQAPNNFADKALKHINTALKNSILIDKTYLDSQQYWFDEFSNFYHYYQQHILTPINQQATDVVKLDHGQH